MPFPLLTSKLFFNYYTISNLLHVYIKHNVVRCQCVSLHRSIVSIDCNDNINVIITTDTMTSENFRLLALLQFSNSRLLQHTTCNIGIVLKSQFRKLIWPHNFLMRTTMNPVN